MRLLAALLAMAAPLALTSVSPVSAQDAQPVPPPVSGELAVPPGYTPAPPPPPVAPYAQQPTGAQQPLGSQPAAALEPYVRHGFTLELGLGVAWLHAGSLSELALHGLTIGLGAFLSPSVAIEGRITGATIIEDGAASSVFSSVVLGMQYWPNDWLTISGGIGTCVVRSASSSSDFGFALDARIGAAFVRWRHGLLRASLELTPGWIDGELITMTALALEYQYY